MNINKEVRKLEKKIAYLKAKAAKSDARRKKTAIRKVTSVLKQYGYRTIQELLEVADTVAVVTATKRKRAKITEPLRKSVISTLKGGKTVAHAAKIHKVSTATVNNIKRAAGLTKSKKTRKSFKKVSPTLATKKLRGPKTLVAAQSEGTPPRVQ